MTAFENQFIPFIGDQKSIYEKSCTPRENENELAFRKGDTKMLL